jgi:hypothetical protein
MQPLDYRLVASILVAVMLSACGGIGTQPATALPPALAPAAARNAPAGGGLSPLIYVSDVAANTLTFYAYSNGKERGSISSGLSEPQGVCSDASGNVFVANTNDSNVIEYAHGAKTSSQTLQLTGELPAACATSATGILAVANICSSPSCDAGNVAFFAGESGSPTSVTCPNLFRYYFLGYDKKGDLFVDGQNPSGQFSLCEIAKGSSKGKAIRLDKAPAFPGGVQWDGTDLAVQDQGAAVIDRYKIHGTSGKLEGTVTLSGTTSGAFYLTSKKQVLAFVGAELGFFHYPEGGNPTKKLALKGVVDPLGFTVSPSKTP